MNNNRQKLNDLLLKLTPGMEIYLTRKGYRYHYKDFRNEKLYFDIPNHNNPKKPNVKSITSKLFCSLLNNLEDEKFLTTKGFPFKDCRIAGFYGFINILNPDKYIKTHGKISIIK